VPGIRLEPFGERHRPGFRALLADPQVRRYTRVPEPPPPDFDNTWVSSYEERRAAGTAMNFAVEDEDGTFLGIAVAPAIDVTDRAAELGYVLAPAARGRGAATEALGLLTGWAFAQGMHRLYLVISVENDASKRVALRAGYQFEGVLRGVHFKQGRFENVEYWSRLATD
jgi:RimJ/RimL family protein N-acetyltransferase